MKALKNLWRKLFKRRKSIDIVVDGIEYHLGEYTWDEKLEAACKEEYEKFLIKLEKGEFTWMYRQENLRVEKVIRHNSCVEWIVKTYWEEIASIQSKVVDGKIETKLFDFTS